MLPSMYNRNAEDFRVSRKRQIDTLKAFNDKVTAVQEDVEYKIDFETNAGAMCLGVQLPSDFPNEKPILTIHPPVSHAWVTNDREVTNAPGILNFTVHSDLGRVVNAVIREWQARPPSKVTNHTGVFHPPPASEEFPSLSAMSNATLQSLVTSSDRMEEYVSALPHWRSWNNAVQAKIAEIERIARDNLNKEADFTELRQQVVNKVSEAQTVKAGCEQKAKELARLSEAYEPEKIRAALQDASHESDVAAEDIAEQFLAGDIDVDQFLLDYVEIRKMGQIRKTKEEKLGKQLREMHRAGF